MPRRPRSDDEAAAWSAAALSSAVGTALRDRYGSGWGEPKRPATHRQGLKARMNRIQKLHGGDRRAAARAAGIPYSTWNAWLSGKRAPSARNLLRLEGAFARLVMAPAMAAAVAKKGYPSTWAITAVVVADPRGARYINGRGRGTSRLDAFNLESPAYRTFKAEGLDSRRIVNAWLGHGDEAAAQALTEEIKSVYGEEFGFEGDRTEVTLYG